MSRSRSTGGSRTADGPLFPPEHAFVVQFTNSGDGSPCAGRVEHVISGRSTRFDDSETLLRFFQRIRQLDGGD